MEAGNSDNKTPSLQNDNLLSDSNKSGRMTPEKLEKLGLLVAGITHNLSGPLAGLLGTVDLLSYKYPDIKGDFERISKIGKRLQRDIRLLLDKSRKEYTGEVHLINMIELVKEEIEFYTADPRMKHRTKIEYNPPENIPVFKGVYGDFSQSLSNIFTNATEAMTNQKERLLKVDVFEENNLIYLTVEDNGCGMSQEILDNAFIPFFTTKSHVTDSGDPPTLAYGLGLAHVKNLLEPLGCKIRLQSKIDEGTKVTIEIPYKSIDEKFTKKAVF